MMEKTLHEAVREHLEYLKCQGKSERTLYTYSTDLQQVEAFFGPDKKLSAILIPHVAGFLKCDALLKLGNGNARAERTVAKTIRVFRMMLVWAKDTGLIDELPLPKSTPMGHSKQTEVTDAEQQ